ncbi:MAG TPA: DNA adenine methylase [Gemmatimonadaceae bacterium]|nr:DNA adenine methylase [Gemmatimonadaceae bacterium]
MRYIGNKTRLLEFLMHAVRRVSPVPGVAHDAFAGTAAVGRALKVDGWRVISSDLMTYSYVFQQAYVVAQRVPSFAAVRAEDAGFRRALRSARFRAAVQQRGGGALAECAEFLERWLEGECGFVSEHFSPREDGEGGRRYFTRENARRIDAVRRRLHEWRSCGLIGDAAYWLFLAALIEGADRVANTAGVYAAYIKEWQPNALRALALSPVRPVRGVPGSAAFRDDAARVAASVEDVDLLYVDPPYNARQYASYYHVPEIIARGWFDGALELRGKTGLLGAERGGGGGGGGGGERGASGRAADERLGVPSQRSAWCSASEVSRAMEELLAASRARAVVVSYNSEGLLDARDIQQLVSEATRSKARIIERSYRRYRADRDHERRRYRADGVRELLVYGVRAAGRSRSRAGRS